jgi:hypothetical protein
MATSRKYFGADYCQVLRLRATPTIGAGAGAWIGGDDDEQGNQAA